MCLGSLILALIQVVLFIIRSAREANRDNNNGALRVVLCVRFRVSVALSLSRARESRQSLTTVFSAPEQLLECCVRCVYEIVRIFTSFATIVTSISGQSFVQSAKTVTHVCRRNGFGMHNTHTHTHTQRGRGKAPQAAVSATVGETLTYLSCGVL